MNESDLKSQFIAQIPALNAWGECVVEFVINGIEQKDTGRKIDEFLKIPPKPRVKEVDSFLTKAFRRGKKYTNPLSDITDQVGVRFVVLLRADIMILKEIIETSEEWEWSRDRDFEAERDSDPHHFDYQSTHYVVTSKATKIHKGLSIPAGVKCEIQVRTLLQHAYAELSHDRIYKPNGTIDNGVRRQVARSAALVDTTDEIFESVNKTILDANKEVLRIHELASAEYNKMTSSSEVFDLRLSTSVLDKYRQLLPNISKDSLISFLTEHSFVEEKIKERAPLLALYRHPVILVLYFLVQSEPAKMMKLWPFDREILTPIYSDLGIGSDQS